MQWLKDNQLLSKLASLECISNTPVHAAIQTSKKEAEAWVGAIQAGYPGTSQEYTQLHHKTRLALHSIKFGDFQSWLQPLFPSLLFQDTLKIQEDHSKICR